MRETFVLMFTLIIFVACKDSSKEVAIEDVLAPATDTKEGQDGAWIVLFDGTSLDQWRGYLSDDIYPEWNIKDGALVFTPGENSSRNIITKDRFTNFILSLEWKISEEGNSGIFWGVHEDPSITEPYLTGPEIQILDNEGHPDAQFEGGTHKAGSLFDMIACPDELIKPKGAWNLCVIEINHDSNLGKVSMNGKEAFTFPLHGPSWQQLVANSKFKDWKEFGRYKTGHIGLQDHGNQVWFRDIKIKKIN